MTVNLTAQVFGAISMILLFLSYQINTRSRILICHIFISIFRTVHYGLLGAASAMLINLICIIRNVFFYFRDRNKVLSSVFMPVMICLLQFIVTLFAWKNEIDLLAFIGAPLQTIALWMKTPKKIRLLMLCASPLWLVYDAFKGSYIGIVTECFVMTSILISLTRYDIKGKSEGGLVL